MKNFVLWCAAMVVACPGMARAADADRFPFVLPWDDATTTITSVANLNALPAGGNGFVVARNGHFYEEKGRRVRFLGVNMVGSANFPSKADAGKVAARLHKFGVNIVRLHHMDAEWAHPNIFDSTFKDKQHLSPDSLDRLDYFVYQLKQNGVYVNINLHVAREFTAADGFPETEGLHDFDKAVDFFEPRMIELQKNYARDLLTHLNPYTKTRYVEEPAVAAIEINNENTLLGEAWGTKLDTLPPTYKKQLMALWNAWLKRKYRDTAGLKRAWGAADKPFGPNMLQNALFEQGAIHWNVEQNTPPAAAKLTLPEDAEPPSGVKGRVARLTVTKLGTQNWHLQFHQAGLDLVDGEPYTLTFWARADRARQLPVYAGLDKADYHHIGLDSTVSLTTNWQEITLRFTAVRPEKDHSRLTFVLGDALGYIDLASISLRPGAENELPFGTLEAGTIPLGHPLNTPAGQDWIAFLIDTERVYMQTMHDYVKNTLGAKACLTGSQASWGGMGGALRESIFDFADNHAYWQHPSFPHAAWDPKDWTIPNSPMTAAANGGEFPALARYRLANKPFTVSEYNHPAPNEYRAECLPMLAAFAAVQDWDGIYLFDYNGDPNPATDKIRSYFDIDGDPAKMAFLPAAALLFNRFDMAFLHEEKRLHIPQNDVVRLLAKNGPDIRAAWEDTNVAPLDVLNTRFSVAFDKDNAPIAAAGANHPASEFVNTPSSEGPIRWQNQGTDKALFTADSPTSKVIVGYVGGQTARVPGWEVQAKAGGRNFAALTLSAIDGKTTEQSHSLLLTVLSNAENPGVVWNANRTSIGDQWGSGPVQVETIEATMLLATNARSVTVYALDPTGKRKQPVDCEVRGGLVSFVIRPADKTVWYEITTKS